MCIVTATSLVSCEDPAAYRRSRSLLPQSDVHNAQLSETVIQRQRAFSNESRWPSGEARCVDYGYDMALQRFCFPTDPGTAVARSESGKRITRDELEDALNLESTREVVVFGDARGPEVVRSQVWVFFLLFSSPRVFDELLVAVFSLLHTAKTTRQIVVLTTASMPEEHRVRLEATGCCELRVTHALCFNEHLDDGSGCATVHGGFRTVFKLFQMVDFEKVVYMNTDVLFLNEGADEIFEFPRPGFDVAATPGGGDSGRCKTRRRGVTDRHIDRYSNAMYTSDDNIDMPKHINLGMFVARPAQHLFELFDYVAYHLALGISTPTIAGMNEQMVFNVAKDNVPPMLYLFHCIPRGFNCQEHDLAECTENDFPVVFIRHFSGDTKPLLRNVSALRQALNKMAAPASISPSPEIFGHSPLVLSAYLAAFERTKTWGLEPQRPT